MGWFIESVDRTPATLLPETIGDYVGENNRCGCQCLCRRARYGERGFDGVIPEETDRPTYQLECSEAERARGSDVPSIWTIFRSHTASRHSGP